MPERGWIPPLRWPWRFGKPPGGAGKPGISSGLGPDGMANIPPPDMGDGSGGTNTPEVSGRFSPPGEFQGELGASCLSCSSSPDCDEILSLGNAAHKVFPS